jgi:hypothetical protein
LDKFDALKAFMRQLLEHSIEKSEANISIESIFAGDSFSQLCIASGGVPRDFLSLFLKVLAISSLKGEKINKVSVTNSAIEGIGNKMSSIGKDSEGENEVLEAYLHEILKFVYSDHRTNVFLVAKPDLDEFRQFRQALKELVDMRLLHVIDNNTSCAPSDGKRYEAYMIDIGLFENSRPRNFTQLEPGTTDNKGRRDKLRASPRINLEQLSNSEKIISLSHSLQVTEE